MYAYVDNNPVNSLDPLGLCEVQLNMKTCLESIFDESVQTVRLIHKPKKNPKWAAVTRRNKIEIQIPCSDFWLDYELVLEEYYHVLRQWNTGRMNRRNYFWEWLRRGYTGNRFELEAKDFARRNREALEDCLKCK